MFESGHKKVGGKKKGFKKDNTVEETAARLGVDPFDILCLFAKGDRKALKLKPRESLTSLMRLNAAKEACKYLHSQKRAVELSNPDGTGFIIRVEDYTSKK